MTRQGGVGLIEVMVAVLVLSVGFLGVAALLAISLSTNNSAMARSMATVSSYSILDAMRADVANARATVYNQTVTASSCGDIKTSTLPGVQLKAWCQQLALNLGAAPTTTGTVNCSSVGKDTATCTVTITFDDSRSGDGGSSTQKIVTRAML